MHYDAVVIGSGQGGNPLAYRLAEEGQKVAIVEQGKLGGTCVNTGCTPTKTLIASAQVAHYVRNAERWCVESAGQPRVNLHALQQRKEEVVSKSRGSWERKFNGDKGPHLFREHARFLAPGKVQAGKEVLESERIFIDTGCRPMIPKLGGLESIDYLTNVTILELTELPSHLLILGGGYIGLEFAQMFRRFGSKVTVIQKGPQLLPQEDEEIIAELEKVLESEGISIHLNTRVSRVSQVNGQIRLKLDSEDLEGSHLLIATGRTPNTQDLGLEIAGVAVNERGYVVVNERLETTAAGIWAIGDVTGGPAFTHISYNDYQLLYANIYENGNRSTARRLVPYAVYTDPELGRVGLTEKAARQAGRKLKIGSIPMAWVARAIERAETSGCMKLVVDAETDKILGAAMLCSEGGELVQILSTLMLCDKPYTLLKGATYIHPTLAEGFFALMDSVK